MYDYNGIDLCATFRELSIQHQNSFQTRLYILNQGLSLSQEGTHVKHINLAHHSIQECVTCRQLKQHYICSKDNITDIFTKALPRKNYEYLCNCLGLW